MIPTFLKAQAKLPDHFITSHSSSKIDQPAPERLDFRLQKLSHRQTDRRSPTNQRFPGEKPMVYRHQTEGLPPP